MAADRHYRVDSDDTTSSAGSSYQLILDHILTYPGSYEMPLRTMYTLNCAPCSTPSSAGSSPNLTTSPLPDPKLASQLFTDTLLAQMENLRNQPTSLPPSFITTFVQRCFPSDLVKVDFPQALTGLDYLKDLETRRRRDVAATMRRLSIDRRTLGREIDSLEPGLVAWVRAIEDKERKIEALYTQLYVGLRRWILINEMSLFPFNKHNCVAMLNTLYPPVVSSPPTSKLTPAVLRVQRDGFFNYIRSAEKSGIHVLRTLMLQGRAPGDEYGWVAVTRVIAKYLQLANSVINDCADVVDRSSVCPTPLAQKERTSNDSGASTSSRPIRKADSGVSFKSFERPSTRGSSGGVPSQPASPTTVAPSEPPPAATSVPAPARPKTPSGATGPNRQGTALEKLARGLRSIGRGRGVAAVEMVGDDDYGMPSGFPPAQPSLSERSRALRKMRSMGSLEGRSASSRQLGATSQSDAPAFDPELMRRHREKYEAAQQKVHIGPAARGHEV